MRIKILFILEATLGGTRKHVIDLLSFIDTKQFDITFCYSSHRCDKNFFPQLDVIKQRGIKCIEIPMTRNISLFQDFKCLILIYKIISKEKFHIVHSHSSKAGVLGRLAAKMVSRKIFTIYTPHSMAFNLNKIYKYIEKLLIPFTNTFIAVSESEKNEIINNLNTQKIIRINPGVIVEKERYDSAFLRRIVGIPDNKKIILNIGRLTLQKDPLTFFKALNTCVKKYQYTSLYFVWIGDGELKQLVEDYIKINNLGNYCSLLGWRTDIDVLIRGADLFVLTSLYESFGYVTCEAMSAYVPVIATRVVGTTDIVVDGVTGLLFEKLDYVCLANYIIELINDDSLRKTFGMEGNRRVKKYFNVENMVRYTEKLYGIGLKKIKQNPIHRF